MEGIIVASLRFERDGPLTIKHSQEGSSAHIPERLRRNSRVAYYQLQTEKILTVATPSSAGVGKSMQKYSITRARSIGNSTQETGWRWSLELCLQRQVAPQASELGQADVSQIERTLG
jgi:hypothetical protein